MDVDRSQARLGAYMRDHQEKIVGRWTEIVVAGLRGRTSAAEVRREFDDLYALVVRAMSGADEQAAGELRATLAELSRSRARNGFSPSETALAVFALKDAVYELVAGDLVPDYLVFSRMMDNLGLHTFETYASARERIIADQAAAMLELSTPVIRLWEGIIAVPLVGTLDSARTQLVVSKQRFDDCLSEAAEQSDRVVLDLSRVDFMDTTALAVIVGHWRRLVAEGGTFRIAGARYRYVKALWITGLADRLPMYDTVDEALADDGPGTASGPGTSQPGEPGATAG